MSVNELLSPQASTGADRERLRIDVAEDGDVLEALSTETARCILTALRASSGTTSEIAAETGISIQNVGYHLDQLEEVGLVEVAGTRYSSKARAMDVYALTADPLVVEFGESTGRGTDQR